MENQQYTWILKANYYLEFHNAHIKSLHLLNKKLLFSLIIFRHCTLKYEKATIANYRMPYVLLTGLEFNCIAEFFLQLTQSCQ